MSDGSSARILEISTPEVDALMEPFCLAGASNALMQATVRSLARSLVSAAQAHDASFGTSATLIPILRGALPMYVGAESILSESTCVLARCFKTKGTRDVVVEWLSRRPYPRQEAEGSGPVVVLDTIIATGDTVVKLCDELLEMAGEKGRRSVVIMSCYAAPDALKRLADHTAVKYIVVARKAERCDDKGYLVPYTNGDIGDKIYGVTAAKADGEANGLDTVIVPDGEDKPLVTEAVRKLTETNGRKWRLTDGGSAVSQELEFKTFKAAWAFMTDMASAAAKVKHHPEWSNVYNKVSIKWTTHQPYGLTKKDVDLATVTDTTAKKHGGCEFEDLRSLS